MTRNSLAIASLVVVAAMLSISIAVGNSLPSGLRLPSHWGLDGEPDQYAPKWVALLLPAGMTGAVSLLFHFLPALEPRREGLERSQGLYLWGWTALLMMGAAIELAMIATALGWDVRVSGIIIGATGTMLVMIGNQLGKSRSMYLIGIRTPWTLASEEVWVKTHRLAGKLMVAGGFALLAASLLSFPPGMLAAVIVAVIALAAGVPIVYSFLLWRREKEAGQPSA
jgi:uncharacterized membrane protein